ncbi:hypothetical protein [Yoonia vestfoldensis]|uniref:Uncharacterized protein n=1 Tax=Yoonia vestfoldensis TaxID=245188 RepID=A0A1Y0EI44_9RHOB|nr:hypothetical protein [Yoonia vestfoldensis]ARU03138.1 hypothetical protein LOKVESSMR4R_03873 [Yoonia vestfoldensis]
MLNRKSPTEKKGIHRARRARRGVSLFAVMLGLFVFVMGMDLALNELERQVKRAKGQELANIASVLANRWERVIHTCAVDASQRGIACPEFATLSVADWTVLNFGAAADGRVVDVIPSEVRISGTEPATWIGATPVVVSRDVAADLYIASVSQSPVATGLIVFRPMSDLHPLSLAAFRAGLDDWNEATADADEVLAAESICAAIAGCTIGPNDVAVMTYPFVTIESDWLLREPWAGRSYAHEMQTGISSVVDGATGVPRFLNVANTGEVSVQSGALTTDNLNIVEGTFEVGRAHDDDPATGPFTAVVQTVEAASVSVAGTAQFADSLDGEIATVANGVSAGAVNAVSPNDTTDSSIAGNLFAVRMTISGALAVDEVVSSGAITAQGMQISGSTISDVADVVTRATARDFVQGSSLYSSVLQVNSLRTSGCTGC